jgi:2-hydroxychromene-2-carboxylate isomerase|tara:strand:- start:814 stop:1452 length:639 start_codon:yes stop_codon:yes gene_type:complete
MSNGSVDFYIDIKSPYAYLALDPAIKMFDQLGLKWNVWPYTLDIADYLGSATINNDGKIISSNRTPHQWRRVKYSYMDCRRMANLQGKTILGTQKIWDSSLFSFAHLWIKEKSEQTLLPFLRESFQLFWERKLDIENEEVISNLLTKFQLDSAEFKSWMEPNRNSVTSLMDAALSKGIFGVPTFVFEEEIFWGSEKLELIKARATGDYSNLI